MTESFRLRHVNWIVGLFLLLIIAAFVVVTVIVLTFQDTLAEKVRYETKIEQEQLGNLKRNAEVFLAGEPVGRVDKITFAEDRKLTITTRIRKDKAAQIVQESSVLIRQSIVGTAATMDILRGPSGGPPIEASWETPGELPIGEQSGANLADVGQSVGQGMAQIVDNFDRARSAIVWGMNAVRNLSQTTERGVDPAIAEMRMAIEELRATTARTETTLKHTLEDIAETSRTLNDRTKSSSQNLDSNIEEMQQSLAVVERASVERLKGIQASLDKLNRDIERAVDSFEDVMKDVKRVSQDLPETKDSLDNAIGDADDVIDGVKRHPLLRKFVEQEQGTRQAAPAGIRGGGP